MEIEKIESSVKEIISNKLGLDEVKSEDNLRNDLGTDSLDLIEIMMDLEMKFDIKISDNDAEGINTVQDAINVVSTYMNKKK